MFTFLSTTRAVEENPEFEGKKICRKPKCKNGLCFKTKYLFTLCIGLFKQSFGHVMKFGPPK